MDGAWRGRWVGHAVPVAIMLLVSRVGDADLGRPMALVAPQEWLR